MNFFFLSRTQNILFYSCLNLIENSSIFRHMTYGPWLFVSPSLEIVRSGPGCQVNFLPFKATGD